MKVLTMKCKKCKDEHSWHEWAEAPYCSPYCAGTVVETSLHGEWTRHERSEIIGQEKNILQPLKRDGTIDKRFVDTYGTERIEKEMKITKDVNFDTEINIYENKTAILSFQRPYAGVIIEDIAIAQTLKSIWQMLWNNLK